MFLSGIYLPNGMSASLPFSVDDASASVTFPGGRTIVLPIEGSEQWQEGTDRAERFVGDAEDRVLMFSTRDSDRHAVRVTVYRNGRCRTGGQVHAMAQTT